MPFGHLAEGNVHVNILEPGDPERLTADILGAAASLGGTISAEHGVGIAKSKWLHLVRTPAELAAAAAREARPRPHRHPQPRGPHRDVIAPVAQLLGEIRHFSVDLTQQLATPT